MSTARDSKAVTSARPSSPKSDSDRGQPSAADARGQLERILESLFFRANTQRRTLLRFLVEEALAGRAGRMKGFTIAVAVFGRDETFDAQADPVVRLEARRLRRDLDGYYAAAGAADRLRISIPKGAYVPLFEWQDADVASGSPSPSVSGRKIRAKAAVGSATPKSPRDTANGTPSTAAGDVSGARNAATDRSMRRRVLAALAGIAIVVTAVIAWLWNQRLHQNSETATAQPQERGPSVIVLPFETLSTHEDDQFLAAGITQEIITDLYAVCRLQALLRAG